MDQPKAPSLCCQVPERWRPWHTAAWKLRINSSCNDPFWPLSQCLVAAFRPGTYFSTNSWFLLQELPAALGLEFPSCAPIEPGSSFRSVVSLFQNLYEHHPPTLIFCLFSPFQLLEVSGHQQRLAQLVAPGFSLCLSMWSHHRRSEPIFISGWPESDTSSLMNCYKKWCKSLWSNLEADRSHLEFHMIVWISSSIAYLLDARRISILGLLLWWMCCIRFRNQGL